MQHGGKGDAGLKGSVAETWVHIPVLRVGSQSGIIVAALVTLTGWLKHECKDKWDLEAQ